MEKIAKRYDRNRPADAGGVNVREILGIKEGQNPKLPASVEDLIDIEDYMTGDDLMYAGGDEKEAAKKAKRSAKKKAVIPKSK